MADSQDDAHESMIQALRSLRRLTLARPIPGIEAIDPKSPPEKETIRIVIWIPGSLPEPPEHFTAKVIPWLRFT